MEDRVGAMEISIRALEERDLPAADRICRLAFGTFLGLPDPTAFMGDASFVETRWRADPAATIAAEVNGELAGSNFVTRWGSFGFFGPLTVRPDLWDRGIARRLLERTMELFASWGTRHHGLFTFPHSPKHIGMYQRFGFWARFLTPIMSRPVPALPPRVAWSRFSDVAAVDREAALQELRDLTTLVHEGLDLAREVRSVDQHQLGDTLLVRDGDRLVSLAVCHRGARTEAGSGTCYVKFAAVRPDREPAARLHHLLDACDAFAAAEGARTIVAGVNMARREAYRIMIERGFRTFLQGVAMQKPDEEGFNRPGAYVLDDWR